MTDDVERAFPDVRPWGPSVSGTPPEIFNLERDFGGRSWTDITTKTCNYHSDAYTMLDVEPLAYFLPAFLRAAVTDPNGQAAEYLVYFVCGGRYAEHLYLALNADQRDLLMGVVAWVLRRSAMSFRDERQEYVQRLREWRSL